MTVIKMGMEGHMPSRQLGTLEINKTNMSGRGTGSKRHQAQVRHTEYAQYGHSPRLTS